MRGFGVVSKKQPYTMSQNHELHLYRYIRINIPFTYSCEGDAKFTLLIIYITEINYNNFRKQNLD